MRALEWLTREFPGRRLREAEVPQPKKELARRHRDPFLELWGEGSAGC